MRAYPFILSRTAERSVSKDMRSSSWCAHALRLARSLCEHAAQGQRVVLCVTVLLTASAFAQEALPAAEETPPAFNHKVEMTGYAMSRTGYGRSRWSGLVSTQDLPQWTELVELNGQLKVSYLEHGFVSADVSLVGNFGFDYRSMNADGYEQFELSRDAVKPLIALSEIYLLQEITPWLNVMAGKKRLVWGPGQAFNPTDLLNVRRDPTDPTFQRAGAWLARVEVPLESSAFTLLFAPMVTESAFGIPYAFVAYPDWDTRNDNQLHYLVAARAYFLVADTDINVMGYFSNKYLDELQNKVRIGASLSRIFFDTWEVHAEGLVQQGSSRVYVDHSCVKDVQAAIACNSNRTPFAARSRLDDTTFYPQVLAGVRKQFSDDSFLQLEYLYQADGYRPDQYQDLISGLDGINQARALGIPVPPSASLFSGSSAPSSDATPQRFSFQPLAKHYAFVTFQKPRIRDDFTAQVVVLANLQDLSTLWTPSVSWSAQDWILLSLVGFIPVPGPDALAAKVPSSGRYVTEYGSFPQLFRAFFEVRVFY
jgi:hypothetical protein